MRKRIWTGSDKPGRLILAVVVATGIAGNTARADEYGPKSLPEVEVTASRLGSGIAGASTTVITAEDIKRSTADTLPELLSYQAGIQARDFYSASAADSVVDIRGFGATAASNTLVLVNGRRLNDFDLAAVDFGNIPLESIERIEIVRGNAGAVLYGDGAIGGVINIVTKTDVPEGTSGQVSAKYGSYKHRETNASATHRSGDISLSAYGTYINAENYRRNNDVIQKNLVTELRQQKEQGDIYVNLSLDDQYLGTPGARLATVSSTELEPEDVRRDAKTPDDFTVQSGISLTVGGTRLLSDSVEAVLDIGYRIKDVEARTVSNTSPQFDSYIDTELSTISVTPRLNVDFETFDMPSSGTVGIDYYYSDYNSDRQLRPDTPPFHIYDGKQHSAGFYGQNTLDLTETTQVSVGARTQYTRFIAGDIHDPSQMSFPDGQIPEIDDESRDFAFNLGIDHAVTSDLTVFGRVARSFRVPTIDERIGSDSGRDSFELKTQWSRDAEVGARYRLGNVRGQSSIFFMRLRDELHFNPDTFENQNFDPTRRVGVENSLDWQATDDLRLSANLSYTDAEFTAGPFSGKTVPLVSDWVAGTSLYWDILEKFLSLSASANYYASKNMENDESNFQPEMPGYTLVDLKLGGEYGQAFWSASLDNVFDTDYYNYAVASSSTFRRFNAYPLPGRTFFVEAGMKF